MKAITNYGQQLYKRIHSLARALKLSLKHLLAANQRRLPVGIANKAYFNSTKGLVTLQYPHEQLPVPDQGRYKLHNAIEDCIVCDKCVKVCPVNCIEIEAVRSPTLIGKTSNGKPKRIYPAKFDIDMAKCCFCGLCTTVCPTKCLTMTPEYDFSVFNFAEHNVSFSEMTPEEIKQKKQVWQDHVQQKSKATPARQ